MRPAGAALKPVCEIFHKLARRLPSCLGRVKQLICLSMAVLDKPQIPQLQNGDVLTRAEFERRYAAMPHLKKAELIDGIVYMAPPVSSDRHAFPHSKLVTLIQTYATKHSGLEVGDNGSIRLDTLNEPQPDVFLMRDGGQASRDAGGYVIGAPELVAEIAASSASYDLHQKKRTYLRAGVLEYLVWIVGERRIVLWQLSGDDFVEVEPSPEGLLESPNFPGLVIDTAALVAGDLATALSRLG